MAGNLLLIAELNYYSACALSPVKTNRRDSVIVKYIDDTKVIYSSSSVLFYHHESLTANI
jgi:hypothetical protein